MLFGEGHKEYLADKWQDEDNYLFTLMSIARELNSEALPRLRSISQWGC